ncbi:hypothetical protein H6503_06150 [Candidatus Woesearchaeota archaeon]|nr:hypothetical protein [Candidatus Woesearchaeota archaeon]
MLSNKVIYYLSRLKYYLILFIPLIIIIILSAFGLTKYDIPTASEILSIVLADHWIELLVVALIFAIGIWIFMHQASWIQIRKLKKESEERKRKADVHDMRYGVHKD